jgi:hypothetical protein
MTGTDLPDATSSSTSADSLLGRDAGRRHTFAIISPHDSTVGIIESRNTELST